MSELFIKKHSKLGIASTILAISIWIYFGLLLYLFLYTDVISKNLNNILPESNGIADFKGFGVAILLLGIIFLVIPIFGHFIGFILGISGCLIKNKKKLFAVIGLSLNILPFALGIIFYVIGSF